MAPSDRVYGGVPAEERRAQRRAQLLAAGLDLLAERSAADLTVGDICARAGLSKRYFYEQFDGLDAFTDALMNDAVERLTAAVFGDAPPDGVGSARARLASFVREITSDRRLARLVFVETFGVGSLGRHRHALVHRSVALLLDDFLSPEQSPIADDTDRRLAAYSLAGATSELLVAWTEGEIDASPDVLVDHLTQLFERMAAAPPTHVDSDRSRRAPTTRFDSDRS